MLDAELARGNIWAPERKRCVELQFYQNTCSRPIVSCRSSSVPIIFGSALIPKLQGPIAQHRAPGVPRTKLHSAG